MGDEVTKFHVSRYPDAVAPDGALWMVEDTTTGGLYRVTPVQKEAAK